MTRYPDYWTNALAKYTSHEIVSRNSMIPTEYQLWINAYFGAIADRQEIKLAGPISISIRQSKRLFNIRPLWAMSFEEKRFKDHRRIAASMATGVFENPSMNAWAFQRELIFDLNRRLILVERTMDASGNLQKLALMRSNRNTTDLQVEHRVNRRNFNIVTVPQIGRRTSLSVLLSSPRSIAENVPATLI